MHLSTLAKWSLVVAVVAAFVITGATILLLVRGGTLNSNPWEPIGTALAIFGAISALVIGIAEADIGTHQTKRDS
ncbi:hypothetical protein KV102_10945 [Mumia sp. zg.B53]|uniref:hypothetical protein n=1 Tax=unclassified Mumia TaxID=2621872 RepID=UPI001C6E09E1|nr:MULTISPECIES: hypothetical protein [unclassified Mumia]MBW9206921.1 hypothetical protein [Mumia sp. zg.B17]MBW9210745.1 hypothetical protein [Mumia sp. zg.B21]MBW9215358.1 hypothetical protein [Mumia sp. zg.B53]MDD9350543.1 hypothetical protein [Mumia sp.]